MVSPQSTPGPVQKTIETKLNQAFSPLVLQVFNESHMHSVPPGSESHFKLVMVSEQFAGLGRVARQRQVYQELAEELKTSVHALSQHLFTPEEWAERQQKGVAPSPECAHKK